MTKITIEPSIAVGVNAILSASKSGVPSDIKTILEELEKVNSYKTTTETLNKELLETRKALEEELKKTAKASSMVLKLPEVSFKPSKESDVKIPEGEVTWKKANEVFDCGPPGTDRYTLFNFNIPVWSWKAKHPHVPDPDPDYIFRDVHLVQMLWALLGNRKTWISGPTGTGKSTLVKEIAARLNWPMSRVNFDSEITRMDLIGRDTLTADPKTGATVSKFVEGILPQTMQGPYILLCDEMDFIRPDVSYVFQRALEDQGLLLNEDGGRLVQPNPMFRIIATANTQGQGDDVGIYQGVKNQSAALLDRFTVWIDVDYLDEEKEKNLLKAKVKGITPDQISSIMHYVKEHRKAFSQGDVVQPISPRGIIALGDAIVAFTSMGTDKKKSIQMAYNTVILNKSNLQDRSVLRGVIDRVYK